MQPNKAYHRHQESLLSNFNGGLGLEEDCGVGGGSSTSGGGSLFSNTISNHFDSIMTNNIYDVLGAEVASVLQTSLSFASSAGMTNVNVRLPFTTAQRQELERQTAIYKFMMSSVPVPPQLLVPISNSTTPSNHYTHVKGGSLELGISNSCTDPEPWRCRRTDGKKWRCSRDVIPEQKYCERHSHKCRPRSRKPVELNHQFNNNSTNLPYSKSHFLNHRDRDKNKNNINNHQSSTSISSTGVSVSAASHDQLRCLEWFMKGENFPVLGSNQELQQIMNTKLGLSRNANEYDPNIDIDIQKQQQQHERVFNLLGDDDQSSLLLVPKLTPFELGTPSTHQTIQETRHFIDAWSIPETERGHHQFGDEVGNRGGCGSSSNEKLPFSSLTLAMCGGNEYETNNNDDNENQNLEMGFGIMGSEGTEQVGIIMKSQSQWLNPVSWMDSTPGGPLAEALCLGIAGSTVEASSRGCNSSGTTSSRSSC